MVLEVVSSQKFSAKEYDRAHTLIGKLPGEADSFQPKADSFILTFKDGTQEQAELLQRHGFKVTVK